MKKTLLLFIFLLGIANTVLYAQSKKITGTVVAADDGSPIPGVSVSIQGTTKGVITDGNGKFTLTASVGEVIVAKFVGYNPVTMPVNGAGEYSIKLATDTKQLDEVVINDAYGIQAKKSYTGAAASVNGKENENKPMSTPLEALQGELPGVQISINSGQPGANQSVRIRGLTSFTSTANEPLYVVDGMIINSGNLARGGTDNTNVLAGLNEDDIEDITVLKDAAATAIYGSRGGPGVILITTKRGKLGKYQVHLDVEAGTTTHEPLPQAGIPLTGQQFSDFAVEAMTNAGTPQANINTNITNYNLYGASNNWYALVTQLGRQEQYNASISGGSENTKVFSSIGYFSQDGTVIGANLHRINGTLNIDSKVSNRISSSLTINASNINQNNPYNSGNFANPLLAAYFLRPEQLAYTSTGALNSSTSGNTNFSSIYNPLYLVANDKKQSSQTHLLAGETLKWNIIGNLNFTSFTSIDFDDLEEVNYNNGVMGDGAAAHGQSSDYYTRYFNWLTRNFLQYRYDFKNIENTYIDVTAGYEAEESDSKQLTATGNTYPATQPLLTALSVASNPTSAGDSFSDYNFDSFFARAAANYKNLLSASGSFRRDGSSRFGANKPYGDFWAIGGAANIDNFSFFKKQNILSSTKARISYGETGNANFGNYTAIPTAGYGGSYAGGNVQNFNTIGNVNLTWESQKKFDLGADFGFFNDRLMFNLDYYNNNIDKLIQSAPLAYESGFSSILENIGAMRNKGVEVSIKGIAIKTANFNWTTSFNISHNANTVTSTVTAPGPNVNQSNYWLAPGWDYQTYYVRLWAGADPNNGNGLWYTNGSRTASTNVYSNASLAQFQQADPKITSGLSNTFNYKGIILTVDFYGNFGNTIYDSYGTYLNSGAYYLAYNKYQSVYLNSWRTPGQITNFPRYVAGGTDNGTDGNASTRFYYYGDFIRLKNISLGYDFKNLAMLKKYGISKLYLYARATNLWLKTYDKNLPFDPEVATTGASNVEQTQPRTATIGLNIGL